MKKILITGAAGFIANNLIRRCYELGYSIYTIDKLKIQDHDLLSMITHEYVCDIRDFCELNNIFETVSPDFVIHLAARTDLDGILLEDYSSNTDGVDNVCRAIISSTSIKSVVFASSMLVCDIGYYPKDIFDFCPSTVYGHSKVESEKIVRKYHNKLPKYCIVRPTSIWGPFFREPYRNFFDLIKAKKYFNIKNNRVEKTYGYVENTVNQLLSLLMCDKDLSMTLINLGDSESMKINKWANSISECFHSKPVLEFPYVVFIMLAKLGDFLKYFSVRFPMTTFRLKNMTTNNVLDCSIAVNTNQYHEISITDGVNRTTHWLNKN